MKFTYRDLPEMPNSNSSLEEHVDYIKYCKFNSIIPYSSDGFQIIKKDGLFYGHGFYKLVYPSESLQKDIENLIDFKFKTKNASRIRELQCLSEYQVKDKESCDRIMVFISASLVSHEYKLVCTPECKDLFASIRPGFQEDMVIFLDSKKYEQIE